MVFRARRPRCLCLCTNFPEGYPSGVYLPVTSEVPNQTEQITSLSDQLLRLSTINQNSRATSVCGFGGIAASKSSGVTSAQGWHPARVHRSKPFFREQQGGVCSGGSQRQSTAIDPAAFRGHLLQVPWRRCVLDLVMLNEEIKTKQFGRVGADGVEPNVVSVL